MLQYLQMITMKIDYNITRKKLNEYVIDLIYDILEKYGKYFDKEIIEIFEQKKKAKANKF